MASKPAFAQSAQVDHPKFGLGSVLSCNEEYIVIKFDDHGEKKFVLSIVMPNLKKRPCTARRETPQFKEEGCCNCDPRHRGQGDSPGHGQEVAHRL